MNLADHGDRQPGALASDPPQRITLDMLAVTRQALGGKVPTWQLEYLCDGQPFYWRGLALHQGQADTLARLEIADANGFFVSDKARLVACCEVSA